MIYTIIPDAVSRIASNLVFGRSLQSDRKVEAGDSETAYCLPIRLRRRVERNEQNGFYLKCTPADDVRLYNDCKSFLLFVKLSLLSYCTIIMKYALIFSIIWFCFRLYIKLVIIYNRCVNALCLQVLPTSDAYL